jgi:hypothetical protein
LTGQKAGSTGREYAPEKHPEKTMKRRVIAGAILASALAAPACANGVDLGKTTIEAGDGTEVPVEMATPAGNGPFPPVLLIHGKRGYDGAARDRLPPRPDAGGEDRHTARTRTGKEMADKVDEIDTGKAMPVRPTI